MISRIRATKQSLILFVEKDHTTTIFSQRITKIEDNDRIEGCRFLYGSCILTTKQMKKKGWGYTELEPISSNCCDG